MGNKLNRLHNLKLTRTISNNLEHLTTWKKATYNDEKPTWNDPKQLNQKIPKLFWENNNLERSLNNLKRHKKVKQEQFILKQPYNNLKQAQTEYENPKTIETEVKQSETICNNPTPS